MKSSYFTLLSLLCLLFFSASRSNGADKPNVVILFADDAGYADFGFQPDARPDMAQLTPHIDSIAKHGVRCSQGYPLWGPGSPGFVEKVKKKKKN
jgi:hypothetical protein